MSFIRNFLNNTISNTSSFVRRVGSNFTNSIRGIVNNSYSGISRLASNLNPFSHLRETDIGGITGPVADSSRDELPTNRNRYRLAPGILEGNRARVNPVVPIVQPVIPSTSIEEPETNLPNYDIFNENPINFEEYLNTEEGNFTERENLDYDDIQDTLAIFSTDINDPNFRPLRRDEELVDNLDDADYLIFTNPSLGYRHTVSARNFRSLNIAEGK